MLRVTLNSGSWSRTYYSDKSHDIALDSNEFAGIIPGKSRTELSEMIGNNACHLVITDENCILYPARFTTVNVEYIDIEAITPIVFSLTHLGSDNRWEKAISMTYVIRIGSLPHFTLDVSEV